MAKKDIVATLVGVLGGGLIFKVTNSVFAYYIVCGAAQAVKAKYFNQANDMYQKIYTPYSYTRIQFKALEKWYYASYGGVFVCSMMGAVCMCLMTSNPLSH